MRLNKKVQTITVLTLLATTLLTSCSTTPSSDTSNKTEVTATKEVIETPSVTIDSEIHADNLMGIYIGKGESQIGLGLDTTTIKDVLGKADKVEKSKASKKNDSATQTWYYKDLDTTITFEKSGKTYTVSSIKGEKKATTLKTGGGITAGSSRKDIVKAYKEQLGEDADTSKNKIVIDNMGYSRLVFTLKKDKVVSVCMELLE